MLLDNITEIYLGRPSEKVESWLSPKTTLTINAQAIEGGYIESTSFEINGTSYTYNDFGKPIPLTKGSTISISLHGDSGTQVYSVDGVVVGCTEDYDIEPFVLNDSKTIEVIFKPNWV